MPNDEYIKRDDALIELYRYASAKDPVLMISYRVDLCERIEKIPAADVEPKREIVPWKVAGTFDDFHQCTKCGNMWPIFSTVEWAYCPVCGCRKFPDPLKGENDVG